MMRKEWTYCRKCSKILHIPECSKIEKSCGICKCGSSVCLLCEGEVHFPLSCNEYEPYANVVAANGKFSKIFKRSGCEKVSYF